MGKGKFVDLTGQRFGNLTVLEYRGKSTWLCRCDCGTEREVRGDHLRYGHSHSCGCLQGPIKHGHAKGGSRPAEYRAWMNMRQRCKNEADQDFANYGGRGITVCERWQEFASFYEDMGPRPSPDHSLDRIDNDGPYSPDNCRWATRQEQQRNTRRNKLLTYKGKTQCIAEWADEIGLSYQGLLYRLRTYEDVNRALTKEPQRRRRSR